MLERTKKRARSKSISISLELWEQIESFSAYGFNRAHAVSYAMIAYQCAYLKTYYLIEFYTALLNNENSDNYYKIINEIKLNNIEVRGIDLNISKLNFIFKDNIIYWGFSKNWSNNDISITFCLIFVLNSFVVTSIML